MQVPIAIICHKVGPSLHVNKIIFIDKHKNRLDIWKTFFFTIWGVFLSFVGEVQPSKEEIRMRVCQVQGSMKKKDVKAHPLMHPQIL
jgi:hypothetical protein